MLAAPPSRGSQNDYPWNDVLTVFYSRGLSVSCILGTICILIHSVTVKSVVVEIDKGPPFHQSSTREGQVLKRHFGNLDEIYIAPPLTGHGRERVLELYIIPIERNSVFIETLQTEGLNLLSLVTDAYFVERSKAPPGTFLGFFVSCIGVSWSVLVVITRMHWGKALGVTMLSAIALMTLTQRLQVPSDSSAENWPVMTGIVYDSSHVVNSSPVLFDFSSLEDFRTGAEACGFRVLSESEQDVVETILHSKSKALGICLSSEWGRSNVLKLVRKMSEPMMPVRFFESGERVSDRIFTITEEPVKIDRYDIAYARRFYEWKRGAAPYKRIGALFDPEDQFFEDSWGQATIGIPAVKRLLWDGCVLSEFVRSSPPLGIDKIQPRFGFPDDGSVVGKRQAMTVSASRAFIIGALLVVASVPFFVRKYSPLRIHLFPLWIALSLVITFTLYHLVLRPQDAHKFIIRSISLWSYKTNVLSMDVESSHWEGKDLEEVRKELVDLERRLDGENGAIFPMNEFYEIAEDSEGVYLRDYVIDMQYKIEIGIPVDCRLGLPGTTVVRANEKW